MKKLTLIRHAKSDWSSGAASDFERPLNRRGNKAVPLMAGRILERGSVPDLLVSSPAQRAVETTVLLAHELDLPQEQLIYRRDIYEATPATLVDVVRQLPDVEHIALIGHNPGLSELGRWLCAQAPEWLPTCAVLELELAVADWSTVAPGGADLLCYDYPKK
ncbi:SixA phosphatase family protein [Pelovirga terrestris]|nr:histidine phosphatase family protein [Pelovirga terrestris]